MGRYMIEEARDLFGRMMPPPDGAVPVEFVPEGAPVEFWNGRLGRWQKATCLGVDKHIARPLQEMNGCGVWYVDVEGDNQPMISGRAWYNPWDGSFTVTDPRVRARVSDRDEEGGLCWMSAVL